MSTTHEDQPLFHSPGAQAIGPTAASYFAKNEMQLKSLYDSIAVGDLAKATEVVKAAGVSARQASLLVRDSSALASAVLAIGREMRW